MKRVPFSQILNNASIDIAREFARLYKMFFTVKHQNGLGGESTLRDYCAVNFSRLPFRKTCISLDDFDFVYGFNFKSVDQLPKNPDINDLLTISEYTYNLAVYNQGISYNFSMLDSYLGLPVQQYIQQVLTVIEMIGYMSNAKDGVTDFVPKNQPAIEVAELVDSSLSYKVLEYNHRSMKGDLERKKAILLSFADKLESQRSKIKNINPSLEDDIFFLFNNVNIRHNNADPEGKKYTAFVASLGKDEIERWYDDTYEMCLIAFLELDNVDRKVRVKQLKEDIQNNR